MTMVKNRKSDDFIIALSVKYQNVNVSRLT